eukprot:163354-Pelagomonas_calceolata.AAC.10
MTFSTDAKACEREQGGPPVIMNSGGNGWSEDSFIAAVLLHVWGESACQPSRLLKKRRPQKQSSYHGWTDHPPFKDSTAPKH